MFKVYVQTAQLKYTPTTLQKLYYNVPRQLYQTIVIIIAYIMKNSNVNLSFGFTQWQKIYSKKHGEKKVFGKTRDN